MLWAIQERSGPLVQTHIDTFLDIRSVMCARACSRELGTYFSPTAKPRLWKTFAAALCTPFVGMPAHRNNSIPIVSILEMKSMTVAGAEFLRVALSVRGSTLRMYDTWHKLVRRAGEAAGDISLVQWYVRAFGIAGGCETDNGGCETDNGGDFSIYYAIGWGGVRAAEYFTQLFDEKYTWWDDSDGSDMWTYARKHSVAGVEWLYEKLRADDPEGRSEWHSELVSAAFDEDLERMQWSVKKFRTAREEVDAVIEYCIEIHPDPKCAVWLLETFGPPDMLARLTERRQARKVGDELLTLKKHLEEVAWGCRLRPNRFLDEPCMNCGARGGCVVDCDSA